MMNNNAKLMARYKDGYSIKDSLNRIEDKSEDVAQMNLDKLAARKAVGTIDGNGDGIVRDK